MPNLLDTYRQILSESLLSDLIQSMGTGFDEKKIKAHFRSLSRKAKSDIKYILCFADGVMQEDYKSLTFDRMEAEENLIMEQRNAIDALFRTIRYAFLHKQIEDAHGYVYGFDKMEVFCKQNDKYHEADNRFLGIASFLEIENKDKES